MKATVWKELHKLKQVIMMLEFWKTYFLKSSERRVKCWKAKRHKYKSCSLHFLLTFESLFCVRNKFLRKEKTFLAKHYIAVKCINIFTCILLCRTVETLRWQKKINMKSWNFFIELKRRENKNITVRKHGLTTQPKK